MCNLPFAIGGLEDKPAVLAGVSVICQACVALWIWSVWSWRMGLKTAFRPGSSASLLGEFKAYGYNESFMKFIGFVKLTCATTLGAGIIFDDYVQTIEAASAVFIGLMFGAIVSHARVCDPLTRYVAAAIMGALGNTVLIVYYFGCAMDVEHPKEDGVLGVIELAATPMNRNLIGGFVLGGCFFMWLSSYMRGDYHISS